MEHKHTPAEIERASMDIIEQELLERGIVLSEELAPVIKRVIHATADFDFAETITFTENAVPRALAVIRKGTAIITDTNMARSGVSVSGLERLGGEVFCLMADPDVAVRAKEENTTRAVAAIKTAAARWPEAVFAVGNAPTALFELAETIRRGYRPALVIAAPVGFVNVVEGKKMILETCLAHDIPAIVSQGRKGGSAVAAAICNALIYMAADLTDPVSRGW